MAGNVAPRTSGHGLTPPKVEALRLIAESRFLSTPQLAALLDKSEHATRLHLSDLQNMGLAEYLFVPGVAVGSKAIKSSYIHFATRAGLAKLEQLGVLPEGAAKPTGHDPSNLLLLAHGLAVRNMLVYLTRLARAHDDHEVEQWDISPTGAAGIIPDATFVYRFGSRRIAGMVEADRGTERGRSGGASDRWAQKVAGYAEVLGSPEHLETITGAPAARLVVTVPTEGRASWVLGRLVDARILAQATWVGVQPGIITGQANEVLWHRPDGSRATFLPRSG